MSGSAREIAAMAPMPRLLGALGFAVNERTHRAPCLLHGGSNSSAFSWREDGRWRCHSCGRGGDRIALVRAAKQYTFREAIQFLAALAGVEFHAHRATQISPAKRAQAERQSEMREQAAFRIGDELSRLRRHYTDALHRTERLQARVGEQLLRAKNETERDALTDRLARLCAPGTFYFAAWNFVWDAQPDVLARFAMASPAERRRFILEGERGENAEVAA